MTRKPESPEHMCWRSIRDRCTNPNHASYKYYGGRGIKYDPRWESFDVFIADVGMRPSKHHSIDRYPDNNGNYEPGNVRWATPLEQHSNTRRTKFVEVQGKTVGVPEACRILGLRLTAAQWRIDNGWTPQEAISEPIGKHVVLTAAQRAQVRKMTGSQESIAAKFGVAQSVIGAIKSGNRRRRKK